MIRKFRAIVLSRTEPEDHHVIWAIDGKVLYWGDDGWESLHLLGADGVDIELKNAEDIDNLLEALDALFYKKPEITSFTMDEAGTYEKGVVITTLTFSWKYNKSDDLIKSLRINNTPLDVSVRYVRSLNTITEDSQWTLTMNDGENDVSSTVSINFVDYVYCTVGTTLGKMTLARTSKVNFNAKDNEYIYIFIPASIGYTKIIFNDVDVTSDFKQESYTHEANSGTSVEGILYTSLNHSLGTLTLKFE